MSFKPMRMRWSFVLQLARSDLGLIPGQSLTAKRLASWAASQKEQFPEGMSLADAQWILANPNTCTDGEP